MAVKQGRKKKPIQDRRYDYHDMDQDEEEAGADFRDDEISNIVEVYDFPAEFKTEDLLKLFQAYQYVSYNAQHLTLRHFLKPQQSVSRVLKRKNIYLKFNYLIFRPWKVLTKLKYYLLG